MLFFAHSANFQFAGSLRLYPFDFACPQKALKAFSAFCFQANGPPSAGLVRFAHVTHASRARHPRHVSCQLQRYALPLAAKHDSRYVLINSASPFASLTTLASLDANKKG